MDARVGVGGAADSRRLQVSVATGVATAAGATRPAARRAMASSSRWACKRAFSFAASRSCSRCLRRASAFSCSSRCLASSAA